MRGTPGAGRETLAVFPMKNIPCPVLRRLLFRLGPLLAAGVLLFGSGCATITRGTKEALVVESFPSGAEVRLSNGMSGTTPSSFKIPRKGDVAVTVSKPGYETVTVNITTQVAKAGAVGMAGNVLIGGVIGAGVDAMSGGMLEHQPNPVKITLVPLRKEGRDPKAIREEDPELAQPESEDAEPEYPPIETDGG